MTSAAFAALLAALLIAGPGHAAAQGGSSVLWATGASFLDHVSDGIPGGVFSPNANSFQSTSSAGADLGKPKATALLLAGLGLMGWIALRRSRVLRAAE